MPPTVLAQPNGSSIFLRCRVLSGVPDAGTHPFTMAYIIGNGAQRAEDAVNRWLAEGRGETERELTSYASCDHSVESPEPLSARDDERSFVRTHSAMIRRFHEKVSRALRSIIDSLRMTRHSRSMLQRAIISKLIKTLFCVALLVSLVLYPPSSTHAHASAHGVAAVQDADTSHHGGHGAHAHHGMSDVQPHLNEIDNGKSSDTPNCCQGICTAAVIAQSPSVLPDVHRAAHAATWLSSLSPFDPNEHRRPPKHLI